MRNLQFQKAKLKRAISTEGTTLTFLRDNLNSFNEPSGTKETVAVVKGILHSSNSYVSLTTGDAATVQSKPVPMFLMLYEDSKGIQQGDYTMINDVKHKVNGVTDVNRLQLAAEVSLEEVL